MELDEETAFDLARRAVDEAGGTGRIYRNPRHPFSQEPARHLMIDGHDVEIRWGEVSSPAIVSVAGWVFEILDEEISLLMRPSRRS